MHEARAVMRAIASRFDHLPETPPARVRVVIRDPTRADPDCVRMYAEECLRDRGVTRPLVTVEVLSVACPGCGASGDPSPRDPTCRGCGLPLPPMAGPVMLVEEA